MALVTLTGMSEIRRYIGRFAPTPSGPLHMGSLVAALGSYLCARAQHGLWLVRIEDVDPTREVPGAAYHILHTLEQFGLHWDGPVCFQSQRGDAYQAALQTLSGSLFYCTCTRARLRGTGGIYPGTCRHRVTPPAEPYAIRVRTPNVNPRFTDGFMGQQVIDTDSLGLDPVILRKDGFWGYPLAVVVDDQAQGVTEIVRGADLVTMTPVQSWLHRALGKTVPRFRHLPVVRLNDGRKLSKQNGAPALDQHRPEPQLQQALTLLNMAAPEGLIRDDLLHWAVAEWRHRHYRTETT